MTTPAIMLQGTGSDVGKSLLAAGLCRAFTRAGLSVRPFKPQNMSNNAAVVAGGGGEIGRAQALQARACGLEATADMNPVLIKPESDTGAQIVVQGRVVGRAGARDFLDFKARLLPAVLDSFARLSDGADLVVVEGAGSPAEVNLRAGDIANMGFAVPARVPVILVGDIDRGGVIASLIGTHGLLDPAERALLKGSIVNKLRGDPSLFEGGVRAIEAGMGLPCLGVVPFLPAAARLPAEDAVAIRSAGTWGPGAIRIAVPMLARIANFDDLDPLAAEPDVALRMVPPGAALPGDADLVILPGTKATLADLAFLRAQGWDIDVRAHHRRGGAVLGVCGGYQMLGRRVADPDGVEGPPGEADGLGLLDVATRITGDKRLTAASGTDSASGEPVHGYEIHMGITEGPDAARPMLKLDGRPDGAVSRDGRVMGAYLHGLFAADGFRHAFLGRLKPRARGIVVWETVVEDALDSLATHLESHLDLDRILAIARARSPSPGR